MVDAQVISSVVVGHPKRCVEAFELGADLVAPLSMDDGIGADANHLRAWQMTTRFLGTWSMVVEDDAQPVEGFLAQAQAALSVAPTPVVSFYLGQTMPVHVQEDIRAALDQVKDAAWITSNQLLHAVAVAIRQDLVLDMLDMLDDLTGFPIDERIGAWCRIRGHRIAYTVPSLVEHADWPTLIDHLDGIPRDTPRKAWRTGTREEWNSRWVAL